MFTWLTSQRVNSGITALTSWGGSGAVNDALTDIGRHCLPAPGAETVVYDGGPRLGRGLFQSQVLQSHYGWVADPAVLWLNHNETATDEICDPAKSGLTRMWLNESEATVDEAPPIWHCFQTLARVSRPEFPLGPPHPVQPFPLKTSTDV